MSIEIYRDAWGIPHLRAGSARELARAQGRVTARDRAWQLEVERHRAQGTSAAFLGAGALSWDTLARRARLEDTARRCFGALERRDPETAEWIRAYVDGVNEELPSTAAPEFARVGLAPGRWEPWTPLGVWLATHILFAGFPAKLWRDEAIRHLGPDAVGLFAADGPGTSGSNGWLVAGTRTGTGHAVLAGDPHRYIEDPGVYQQIHLACPEFDVVGLAVPGVPGIAHFGHTGTVAWSITNAMADYQDLYHERLRRTGAGVQALGPDGTWHRTTRHTETIEVAGEDPVEIEVIETDRGPVIVGGPEGLDAGVPEEAPGTDAFGDPQGWDGDPSGGLPPGAAGRSSAATDASTEPSFAATDAPTGRRTAGAAPSGAQQGWDGEPSGDAPPRDPGPCAAPDASIEPCSAASDTSAGRRTAGAAPSGAPRGWDGEPFGGLPPGDPSPSGATDAPAERAAGAAPSRAPHASGGLAEHSSAEPPQAPWPTPAPTPLALSLRYPPRVTEDLGFSALLPLLRARRTADVDRAFELWAEPVNVVQAADTEGGLLHRVAGRVPVRAEANRLRPVPAWEPGHDWRGWHDTPRAGLTDGVAVMANQRGPATPLGVEFAPPHRADRITALLREKTRWSAADMPQIHMDTRLASAQPLLDHIQALDVLSPEAMTVRETILHWDRHMAAGSREAALYAAVRSAVVRRLAAHPAFAALADPPAYPDVLLPWLGLLPRIAFALEHLLRAEELYGIDRAEVVREALEEVAAEPPRGTWGDTHRLAPWQALPESAWDAPALSGDHDCVLCTSAVPGLTDLAARGPAARYVWDLARREDSLWVVPLGASGLPGSPHHRDQLPLWLRGDLVPVATDWQHLTKED
ncbi:penicillin acylase family protein [Streptomyces sp. NPDC005483]|uniref:penicillin acylase family protein n=1 Tax=Streptomyces sp. NPDC005483 TaxID=3154882 RepID=UPI0033A74469